MAGLQVAEATQRVTGAVGLDSAGFTVGDDITKSRKAGFKPQVRKTLSHADTKP